MSVSDRARGCRLLVSVAWLVMSLATATVHADDAGKQASRDREMTRRAQQAQRKAEEEKAALLQEKQKLEADAGEAKAQLGKATAVVTQERRRVVELQANLNAAGKARDQLQQEKDALAARVADLDLKLKQTGDELGRTKATLASTQTDLGARSDLVTRMTAANQSCEDRNLKLYGVATELIGKYRSQGVFDTLRRKEPFTGLRKVEVENLLEAYQDRADAARTDPAATPAR